MITAEQLAEKEKAFHAARVLLTEAREKYEAETKLPEMRKLLGTTYRYRNSYSCPEKPSDYWWLYVKVVAIEGGAFLTEQFQTDKHGDSDYKPRHYLMNLNDGYKPVAASVYAAEKKKLLHAIKTGGKVTA
jgi:hypothetical protein